MTAWHLKHEIFGDQPWAVQAEALRRSHGRARYMWAMEQGLGKTATALNEFVDRDDVEILLVLVPQSFKGDWPLAPAEWGVPFIQTGMWPRDPVPYDAECALYAVNYDAVRTGMKKKTRGFLAIQKLLQTRRCMLVIDESKAICNHNSLTAKAVLELAKDAVVVRELNGTPMTESVEDYYIQLRVLGELEGMKPVPFRNRYAKMGGYMGTQVVGINEDRQQELGRILDRCMFRALKSEWRKDLPPQIVSPVHLEMTPRQREHYHQMLEEFYTEIEGESVTAQMILTQAGKLQQISSCLLMQDGKHYWIEEPKDNPKLQAVKEIIEDGSGKVIVVYMHRPVGEMLITELDRYDPAVIRGGMTPEQVTTEKKRFNNDPECRVICLQQVAGARGHTLLGQAGNDRCNRMVFFELHPGLYWYEQVKDRNHRGEQDETCWLYPLIVSRFDQLRVDALTKKKNLADCMDEIVALIREEHGR